MSASTVKLLIVAAEIVGGRQALAEHLGIEESLLTKLLADVFPLPDSILLKAVDIVLEDRTRSPSAGAKTGKGPQVST